MLKNILAVLVIISSQASFGISKAELSEILANEIQEMTLSQNKISEPTVETKQIVLLSDKTEGFSSDSDIQIVSFEGN